MAEFVAVANVADVPPGTATVVRGEGIEVALVNVDGSLYAVDSECPPVTVEDSVIKVSVA